MKNIFLLTFFIIFSLTSFSQKKPNVQTEFISTSSQCDACKERIEGKLNYTKGIKSAELDLETNKIEVKFSTKKITLLEIKQILNQLGYDANESKAKKEDVEKLPKCCQPKVMNQVDSVSYQPKVMIGQNMNQVDSVSYLIGKSIGGNIAREMPEVNRDLLLQGLLNEINAVESLIVDDGGKTISSYFENKTAIKKAKGVVFLENNKKDPMVKVTASGLQYKVITMGEGPKPTETSNVRVHYHGTTPEGKVFDSSVDRKEPITFALNQVIPGWTEGLQLMPVGSKFMLYIPSELAYGESPQGDVIEPFMPLVFEVELLSIEK